MVVSPKWIKMDGFYVMELLFKWMIRGTPISGYLHVYKLNQIDVYKLIVQQKCKCVVVNPLLTGLNCEYVLN